MPNILPALKDSAGGSSQLPAGFAEYAVNDAPFSTTSRGLYVGVAGDVEVAMAGDDARIVFTAVPAGALLPIRCTVVYATLTTATDIIVLY
jgi:hypothetical protein